MSCIAVADAFGTEEQVSKVAKQARVAKRCAKLAMEVFTQLPHRVLSFDEPVSDSPNARRLAEVIPA